MSDGRDKPKVGFGHPPAASQFRKGQSGNPKGRPRKARLADECTAASAADDLLRAELASVVTVSEGGKPAAMTKLAIVTRSQVNNAAKGNPLAQRDVLKAAREVELRDAARAAAEYAEREAAYEDIRKWKAIRTRIWAECTAKGEEPDDPWPHPDDMPLDPFTRDFRIQGPLNNDYLPRYRYYQAYRDFCFIQSVLSIRLKKGPSMVGALWMDFDRLLPKRWQIEFRYHSVLNVMLRLPLRQLRALDEMYERQMLEAERAACLPPPSDEEERAIQWLWEQVQSGAFRKALIDAGLLRPAGS